MTPRMPQQNLFLGCVWKVIASLCFGCVSGFVRYLSIGTETLAPLPVNQIIFLENLFGLGLMVPVIFTLGWEGLKTQKPKRHLMRCLFACMGIMCWYTALKHMQIGYAAALAFTGPIFALLGGFLLLKERLTPLENLGILTSLGGVFLMTRPDQKLLGAPVGLLAEVGVWAVLPLLSAFFIACAKLVSRTLAGRGESPRLMTIYLMLGLVPTTIGPALYNWVSVGWMHVLLLALVGALVVLAHYATSAAYKYATVNYLTPFSFLRLILGIGVGYVLFDEIPTQVGVWMGMGVIGVSLIILVMGKQKGAQQTL